MNLLMPTEGVRAPAPSPWARAPRDLGEVRYTVNGDTRGLADLHRSTGTTSFVVVHRGVVVHESYPGRFASPSSRFQLFSLTKSVTSLLLGIAGDEGLLDDLDTPVSDIVPALSDGPFARVTVRQLLHMSSGVGDVEDWTVPGALINRFEAAVTGGGSVPDLIRSAEITAEPGERFNYSTIDSHVLGWVLEALTGRSLAALLSEKLWGPLGAETDAFYFLNRGRPRSALGGGSLNATALDLARVGLLMARDGVWDGVQLVPADWVTACREAQFPYTVPGELGENYPDHYGYSSQWWSLEGSDGPGVITGLGVYGQSLWVDAERDVVVVKTSTWPTAEDDDRDAETVAAFRAVGDYLAELE